MPKVRTACLCDWYCFDVLTQIKYNKVGQSAVDDDDDALSERYYQSVASALCSESVCSHQRAVATSGFIFRVLCICELLLGVAMFFTELFWMSSFVLEAIIGLSLWTHLLGSKAVVSKAVIRYSLHTTLHCEAVLQHIPTRKDRFGTIHAAVHGSNRR